MGDEKLPFSQSAVAEVTGGGEGGGGEDLHIKEEGDYEFDLCKRGQQVLTPDICKDTVTTKHFNKHTVFGPS